MTKPISRRQFGAAAAGASLGLAMPAVVRAAEPVMIRCSLDTAPAHQRNLTMADYLKKLEAAGKGRIKTELFSSGALFADLNVAKALVQGQVEMAAPGTWTLAGFIPNMDFVHLPIMYAQPVEDVHRAIDGKIGALINQELNQKLKVHVLGPWLDLGFQNWYTTSHPLNSFDDLKDLKIRNAGGSGNSWRTRFFGAIPNVTAWPNVPLALSQRTFDGLITTDESSASSKLWDSGLKYSLQDHQSVNDYIPMLSGQAWEALGPELQQAAVRIWAENVPGYRANMAASQLKAHGELADHGMKFTTPGPQEIAAVRKRMMADEASVAKELKISPELLKVLESEMTTAS